MHIYLVNVSYKCYLAESICLRHIFSVNFLMFFCGHISTACLGSVSIIYRSAVYRYSLHDMDLHAQRRVRNVFGGSFFLYNQVLFRLDLLPHWPTCHLASWDWSWEQGSCFWGPSICWLRIRIMTTWLSGPETSLVRPRERVLGWLMVLTISQQVLPLYTST